MDLADQEAVVELVRSLAWAGALLMLVLIIVPAIKFCVNRFCVMREKEIELEKKQLEYQMGQPQQERPMPTHWKGQPDGPPRVQT